jgi:methylthioribose-1-phosphate isomerase
MCDIIRSLQVRGAPLIGIAAALALAVYVKSGATHSEILQAAHELSSARPTAVNLKHCIDKQLAAWEKTQDMHSIITTAEELFHEDVKLCEQIAHHGAVLIDKDDCILTHCNTGCLVTAGIGTALGIITRAHHNGKNVHVYVDETRPLLQGARLTTWELQAVKVPYTLICDNAAASLMQQNKIQKIIVGADRIAKNGDVANKIGTYNLAVLAKYHQIPFYVAAPYTTFDAHCQSGENIFIEQRRADEVRGVHNTVWSKNVPDHAVFNPAFDVTPAKLVTAYILDAGIKYSNDL